MSFEVLSTEPMREVPPSFIERFEMKPSEIFSDFGWNEKSFLNKTGEYYLNEFQKKETKEFQTERNKYSMSRHPELYKFSNETCSLVGPNCMAFALGCTIDPTTGEPFEKKPLPGQFAHGADSDNVEKGSVILDFGTRDEQKEYYKQMLSDDATALGRDFKEVDANYTPKNGETMIAMVASESILENPSSIGDFHFYRKGESGAWFHKPGVTDVTDRDASGNLILNPETCDRGGYGNFLGYYVWKDK